MATINYNGFSFVGVSDDGRIEYNTTNQSTWSVKIEGRWADRRFIFDDQNNVVGHTSPEDAAVIVELCKATDAAQSSWHDEMRERSHARQDGRADAMDGIEKVRGGAYDRNTW
ncbi:hypothetical protein [Ancylobacter pratisalsi]|uniref:Uncharacterized protein n=1 Tax=Ancylobacter pratisalsi TaxID=1745854 RepID=A0A6P1YSS6_9HYPH|nr:hypothetical protein [Ancylobacter pratisalsi]QIB36528.1 hypothetical protein G3A50_22180 [Ancylobacter pratisalsi]